LPLNQQEITATCPLEFRKSVANSQSIAFLCRAGQSFIVDFLFHADAPDLDQLGSCCILNVPGNRASVGEMIAWNSWPEPSASN
jgi:hypothetical protein